MTAPQLGANRYGKSGIRLVKVVRGQDRHQVRDLTVAIALEGEFAASYVDCDNTNVVATDTMKNTVYALAGEHLTGPIENFGMVLAQHFLEKFAHTARRPMKRLAPEAQALLADHPWPGNVRELEHVIERAVALSSSDTILPDDFLPHVGQAPEAASQLPATRMTLEDVKRWYVNKILEEAGGNKVRAAELLGIDRSTLYRILERQATKDDE